MLHPSEVGRRSFSAHEASQHTRSLHTRTLREDRLYPQCAQHTEKVLHQRPIRRAGFRVPERDDRRRQLAQAELLHRRSEGVRGVESARIDLARELAVGELLGGEHAGGPELLAGGKGGGVEEVVVAVVGVHTAGGVVGQWLGFDTRCVGFGFGLVGWVSFLPEAGVVLEDVVAV